jgi:hypothetical protein
MKDELKDNGLTVHPSSLRTSSFRARLPERAGLGTIAVAFIVAVRDREAGVAGFSRKSLKKQTKT